MAKNQCEWVGAETQLLVTEHLSKNFKKCFNFTTAPMMFTLNQLTESRPYMKSGQLEEK